MDRAFTVTELTAHIKKLLAKDEELQNVIVSGEVSNYKRYPSGHAYFTLKDAGAQLKCVMFKGSAARLSFTPQNGDKVLAIGRIAVYERDGAYQLYVDILQQQGLGALMQAFEKLKKKLEGEGLFAAERKQPLPFFPAAVGVITSPSGAAVRDIITVARRRDPAVKLLLYPVQVQGEEAGGEIVRALRFFAAHKGLADVLIVGRGGGSIEDLWAFNEEKVVRAVAACPLPVISAVGHETDFTLTDFAADQRAATPSQAAELAVPDTAALRQRLEQSHRRLAFLLQARAEKAEAAWERLRGAWALRQPLHLLEERALPVDAALDGARRALNSRLTADGQRLAVGLTALGGLNPLSVLARGYSITACEGHLVRSIEDVRWGAELETTVAGGREKIVSVVQDVQVLEERKNNGDQI